MGLWCKRSRALLAVVCFLLLVLTLEARREAPREVEEKTLQRLWDFGKFYDTIDPAILREK